MNVLCAQTDATTKKMTVQGAQEPRLLRFRIKIEIFTSMLTCLVYTYVFEFASGNFADHVNELRL